jgi:hypothetical protein
LVLNRLKNSIFCCLGARASSCRNGDERESGHIERLAVANHFKVAVHTLRLGNKASSSFGNIYGGATTDANDGVSTKLGASESGILCVRYFGLAGRDMKDLSFFKEG